MSFVEVITNSTLWWEATAVYKSSLINVTLQETTGGGPVSGTMAGGPYSKESFASTLQSLLDTLSANSYSYTVPIDQINYIAIPDTSPLKWGSSFTITFNGTGSFILTIS